MNIDQRFGLYVITRKLIVYTSKFFYVFTPPNPILPGHFIISSIRQVPCSFEYLTNEEVFDYGFTIQFVQKILEKYYCCNSSTISVIDGNSNSNIENFHTHLIIRSKDDVKYFHRDSSLNDEEKQLDNNDNGQDKYNNDHIYNLILNYNFNVECEDKNIELSKSLNLVSSIQNYITQNQMI